MPTIDYGRPLQVLVAVCGHPFDRNAFDKLFSACTDCMVSVVDQPAASRLLTPEGVEGFDAVVLYDMPGVDFGARPRPGFVPPPEDVKRGFKGMLERGVGVVALHHAIASWPGWPEYAELLGGTFLYRPAKLRGRDTLDSGYRHKVPYNVLNVAPEHPVTAGVPASFPLTDELYLYEVFEDEVTPLLRSDYTFDAEHFYSATQAVEGRMNSNADWPHPPGSNLVGWAKRALNSPLVYLQPGDGPSVYEDANAQRLVANAIHWVASDAAKAWARKAVEAA
jgi:type 1 glutamine amidotransferase